MNTPIEKKSTIAEITDRFDRDVARFANLDTGQSATMDARPAMELITTAAAKASAPIKRVLDIGCGAGNNTIKLAEMAPGFDCDLVDLSRPMLEKAQERLTGAPVGAVQLFQGDFRELDLPDHSYDVILAAAVLHHLRDDHDWEAAFEKMYRLTAPGGSVWITDLVAHEAAAVQSLMWDRYGEYLCSLEDEEYRDKVFEYIDREDSPRPVTYQLDLLRQVGFDHVDLLHKNACFAAFGAVKKR